MIDDAPRPRLVKSAHFSLQFTFAGRGPKPRRFDGNLSWLIFNGLTPNRAADEGLEGKYLPQK